MHLTSNREYLIAGSAETLQLDPPGGLQQVASSTLAGITGTKAQLKKGARTLMARVPQVTRTITQTPVKLLVVNKDSKETEIVEVELPRTYKDEEAVKRFIERNGILPEHQILSFVEEVGEPIHTRYAMTEERFARLAVVIGDDENLTPEQEKAHVEASKQSA